MGSSKTRSACVERLKFTPKARTTWSGVKAKSGCASPLPNAPRCGTGLDEKRLEIEAALVGLPIASVNGHANGGISVHQAVEEFLENIKPPQREPRTYTAYKYCLELFTSACKQRLVRDVKREDMLAFIRHLYSLGNGPRTANNRAVIDQKLDSSCRERCRYYATVNNVCPVLCDLANWRRHVTGSIVQRICA
jgi:hypothetical protein